MKNLSNSPNFHHGVVETKITLNKLRHNTEKVPDALNLSRLCLDEAEYCSDQPGKLLCGAASAAGVLQTERHSTAHTQRSHG